MDPAREIEDGEENDSEGASLIARSKDKRGKDKKKAEPNDQDQTALVELLNSHSAVAYMVTPEEATEMPNSVYFLTDEQVAEFIDSDPELARKKNKNKGFSENLQVAVVPSAATGATGVVAGTLIGAGGLAAILCITGAICPETQEVRVDTSGTMIFENLARAPTEEEEAGVVVEMARFYQQFIAEAFGAVATQSLASGADTLETTPTQFIDFQIMDANFSTTTTVRKTVTGEDITCVSQSNFLGQSVFLVNLRRRQRRSLQSTGGEKMVDTQVVDLAIQRADLDIFRTQYAAVAEPEDSIYRDLTEDSVTFVTTTTPAPTTSPIPAPSSSPTTYAPTQATAAPTGATAAPTAPPVVTRRMVGARLGYGFFSGTTIREPSSEEYAGLFEVTEDFYDQVLSSRSAYPGIFIPGSEMTNVVTTFDTSCPLPVIVDFDLLVSFGASDDNTPSAEDIFQLMAIADYQGYIRNYVWNAEPPGTIFSATQTTSFSERGGVSIAPSPQPSTLASPEPSARPSAMTSAPTVTARTTRFVESRLGYSFFAGTTIREPTDDELNGLVTQTNSFYDAQLQLSYPNFYVPGSASMTNILETSVQTATYPVILDFDLATTFTTSDANTPTADQIFVELGFFPYRTYIEQYVWSAEPAGTSLFFDTEMVVFRPRGQSVRFAAPSGTAARVFGSDMQAQTVAGAFSTRTIRRQLALGFFPGTTTRRPTIEEFLSLFEVTKEFFDSILSLAYSGIYSTGSVELSKIVEDFSSDPVPTVVVDFDLTASFVTDNAHAPSIDSITGVIEEANYNDFIMFYVWNAEPRGTSIFYNTNRASLRERSVDQQEPSTALSP
ncbi:expressed unknown protein [Seminavis robusta]|uniref:Uncharacterized protein n=1 Tax=Seminavis robusta TaxID=568900 RepID=A0A9N8D435_9STRA|nr:expressed unknown protein [Seminavis robusta]|eukprot:Sro1_g000020.1 n/a (837) ;mRNA; f:6790-9380